MHLGDEPPDGESTGDIQSIRLGIERIEKALGALARSVDGLSARLERFEERLGKPGGSEPPLPPPPPPPPPGTKEQVPIRGRDPAPARPPIPAKVLGRGPFQLGDAVGALFVESKDLLEVARLQAAYTLLELFVGLTERPPEEGLARISVEEFRLASIAREIRTTMLTPVQRKLCAPSVVTRRLLERVSSASRRSAARSVLPRIGEAVRDREDHFRRWLDEPRAGERDLLLPAWELDPAGLRLVPPEHPVLAFDLGTVQSKAALEWPPREQTWFAAAASVLAIGTVRLRGLKTCLACQGREDDGRCRNPFGGKGGPDDPQRYCGGTDHVWRFGDGSHSTAELVGRLIESQIPWSGLPERFELHLSVPVMFDDADQARYLEALDAVDFRGREVIGRLLYYEPTGAAFWLARRQEWRSGQPFAVMDVGGGTTDIAVYLPDRGALRCIAWGGARAGAADLDRVVTDMVARQLARYPSENWGHPDLAPELRRLEPAVVRKAFESNEVYSREIDLPSGGVATIVFDREEYRKAWAPVYQRIRRRCEEVISKANEYLRALGSPGVAWMLLVGGGTLEPRIRSIPEDLGIPNSVRIGDEDVFHAVSRGGTLGRESYRDHVVERIPREIGAWGLDRRFVPLVPQEHPLERPIDVVLPAEAIAAGASHLALCVRRAGEAPRDLDGALPLAGTRFPLSIRVIPRSEEVVFEYDAGCRTVRRAVQTEWADPLGMLGASREFREEAAIDLESVLADHLAGGQPVSASAIQRYLRERVRPGDRLEIVADGEERLLVHAGEHYVGRLREGRVLANATVAAIRRVVVEGADAGPFSAGEVVLGLDVEQSAEG